MSTAMFLCYLLSNCVYPKSIQIQYWSCSVSSSNINNFLAPRPLCLPCWPLLYFMIIILSTGCPIIEFPLCFGCFLGFQSSYRGVFYHFSTAQETRIPKLTVSFSKKKNILNFDDTEGRFAIKTKISIFVLKC